MGLSKGLFTNVAKTIFSVAGEGAKTATYHQKGVPVYDANKRQLENRDEYNTATGLIEDQNLDHVIDVVEEFYLASQFDGETIKTGDTKYLIIQDDLPIQPQVNEHLTVEGVKKRIVGIEKDLMNVTWSLQCRT